MRERPKSAPAQSKHTSMTKYMNSIKQNIQNKKATETKEYDREADTNTWNPFDDITMCELGHFVLFFEHNLGEYPSIGPSTIDVVRKCLHFYVPHDSYETAWNAWNIIQKFLLPDTSQLNLDKTICRNVLRAYQAQSKELKHNQIGEALFDPIIHEIGAKIAECIPDKNVFQRHFEEFVVKYEQQKYENTSNGSETTALMQQQSSHASALHSVDLIHNERRTTNDTNRPQSAHALPFCHSTYEQDDSCIKKVKYCLDDVIEDMSEM